MRRYLFAVLAGALTVSAAVGLTNWLIDPYWLWKSPKISGLNEFKPAVRDNIRIFKLSARRIRPEVVILGTSRADDGLDPQNPVFEGRRAFNLAAPAQTYEESLNLFRWATGELGAKIVVLGLDFFVANAYSKIPSDYQPGNTGRLHEASLLLSLDTLVESVRTISEQTIERNRTAESGKYNNYREDGLRIVGKDKAKEWGGHRIAFNSVEASMLNEAYLPPPKCAFVFEDTKAARSPMRALEMLLAEAHQKGIDLRIAISPIHARLIEAMAAAGLWGTWEEWKQRVVNANEMAAARAGKRAYPLWDFTGYSAITTESVPAVADADSRMNWYWESSHYKKETGDVMLARMFGETPGASPAPVSGFGTLLTAATLERDLDKIRHDRAAFKKNFPAELAEIEKTAMQAELHRRSLGCNR